MMSEDLPWLIDAYATAHGRLKDNLGRALGYMYDPTNPAHVELVLGLSDAHPASDLFSYWRSFMPFDSPEAVAAQDQLRRLSELRHRGRDANEAPADEGVNFRISDEAAMARAGATQPFWTAVRLVTIRPGTLYYMDEHEPDLTAHPRWGTLPEQTRQDLIDAAPLYLMNGRCRPEEWLGRDRQFHPAEAGYRALLLLLRERPTELDQLPAEVWREWAPILVSWPTAINGAKAEDKQALFAIAMPHARTEMTEALLELVDSAIVSGGNIFLKEELSLLDSEPLASALIDRLGQPMAPNPRADILDSLAGNHDLLLAPVLTSWLTAERRNEDPECARLAVRWLLSADTRSAWPTLEALMESDPEFMESAFLSAGHVHDRRPPDLDDVQIASLYVWLSEHFPAEEDPQFEEVHFVGSRESLGNWRDALFDHLRRSGSRESVEAIKQIVAAFPAKPWLNHALVDAERAYRDTSWEPLSPSELDQLANSRTALVVRTDSDLYGATLEAVTQIQAQLQKDTPSARLLWDTYSERPKSEDDISDYLAIELGRLLNQQGAIVNREVQVRRNKSSGLPERTDLRIEALPSNGNGGRAVLRIPGEVKGAWNRDVIESIRTQLLERYMADFQTDYGVYIVVWFDPSDWTSRDTRRQMVVSYESRQQLTDVLQEEADRYGKLGKQIAIVVLDASLRRSAGS